MSSKKFKKKKNTLKKFLIFQEMETGLEELTFNETTLEETGCLSILYYLLAAQASSFLIHCLFLNTVSWDTFGTLLV